MTISVRQRMNIESFKAQQQAAQQQRENEQKQGQHSRALSDVFMHPSAELKKRCKQYTDDGSDIMTNAIRRQDAFSAFRLALDEGGVELLPSGVQKVHQAGLASKEFIELRDPETWMAVYEYLCELPGAFNRSDLIIAERLSEAPAATAEPPESAPKIDYRQALEDQMVTEYYGPRLQGFIDHLRDVWNVTLSPEQMNQVQRWFERNDVPLTGENFDKLRREVLGLYSQREQAEIELANVRTLDSPSGKAEYLRRLRAFD